MIKIKLIMLVFSICDDLVSGKSVAVLQKDRFCLVDQKI